MENIINTKKIVSMIFIMFFLYFYYVMSIPNFNKLSIPIILQTTQDSSCISPQGWPIPCPEPNP